MRDIKCLLSAEPPPNDCRQRLLFKQVSSRHGWGVGRVAPFPPSSPPSTVPCRSAPWEIWPGNRWASASSVPLADQSYAGEHKAFTQHGLSSQSEPPPIHPSELSEPPSSTLRDFLNLPWPSEAA